MKSEYETEISEDSYCQRNKQKTSISVKASYHLRNKGGLNNCSSEGQSHHPKGTVIQPDLCSSFPVASFNIAFSRPNLSYFSAVIPPQFGNNDTFTLIPIQDSYF